MKITLSNFRKQKISTIIRKQKMKNRIFTFTVLLAVMLFTAAALDAQPAKRGMRGQRMGNCIANDLNLTADQQSKFDEIKTEHEKKMIDLRAELKKARLEMRTLMSADNSTEGDIKDQISKSAEIRKEMDNEKVDMYFSVMNILDDSQKGIWKNHKNRMSMGFGNKFDQGFGPGKGMRGNRGNRNFGPRGAGSNPNCPYVN